MKSQTVLSENKKEILEEESLHLPGKDKPEIVKSVIYLILGVVTALLGEDYGISPFAAAAVGATKYEYSFITFIGAALGYLISKGIYSGIRYILPVFFVLLSKSVVTKKFRNISRLTTDIFFTSFFVLAFDAVYMLLYEVTLSSVIFAFADTLLCGAGVYFFSRAMCAVEYVKGHRKLSNIDFFCTVISAGILLCCLGSVSIYSVYPAHIIACIMILFCSHFKGISGGSVMGVAAGAVLSLTPETSHIFFIYALCGMLSGAFAPIGHYAVSVAFSVTCVCTLILKGNIDNICTVAECATACIAFAFIPSRWLTQAYEYVSSKRNLKTDDTVNIQVAKSLVNAAETAEEVSQIVSRVSEKMDTVINPQINKIYARIQHNVCGDCNFKSVCWNDCFDDTVKSIEKIAEGNGSSALFLSSLSFGKRCSRIQSMLREIQKNYSSFVNDVDSRIKLNEMRGIVSDQFTSMSHLLYDISHRISNEKIYDENISRAIRLALSENGVQVQSAAYSENSFSKSNVDIACYDEPENINIKKISKIISHASGRYFSEPEITVSELCTHLSFSQKKTYTVSTGICQIPFENNKICGDSADILDDIYGNTLGVISDGMGTGKRAAIDSAMTCTLMNRLLVSGFTFESALRLVNSALLIKSSDESLSTVDAVCINPYNGICTFNKAGAAESYVRKKDEIIKISQSSLPVGILRNVEFSAESFEASAENIILMVSDGVKGESDDWIDDALLSWSTDNMQELSSHIAHTAKERNKDGFADDITVLALKIKQNKK